MHPQSSHRTQPAPCQTESGTDIAPSVTITLESISGSRRTTISFMGNTVIHAMTGSRSTKNTGASSGFCKWSTISSAIHSQHSFSTTTSVPPSLPLRSVNSARRMRAIPSWHTLGSRKKTHWLAVRNWCYRAHCITTLCIARALCPSAFSLRRLARASYKNCQQNMFIMLHCISLGEFLVFLFYLLFTIDRLRCHEWHFFDLKQVCVVYISRYSVFYFKEPRFQTWIRAAGGWIPRCSPDTQMVP